MRAIGNFFAVICGIVFLNLLISTNAVDLNQTFVAFIRFTGQLLTIGTEETQENQPVQPPVEQLDPNQPY